MKKRLYNQIKFTTSGKKTAVLEHLVGDMSVTTNGGGYYSEDINRRLMIDLQQYFQNHSDKGIVIDGVPVEIPNSRDDRFISEMRKLIRYDPALLNGIINHKGYTLSVSLAELVKILPKGNKVKSSYRHFKTRLQTEYKIKLEIK